MDNRKIFLISGIFSISVYITILLSIFFYFLANQEIIKKFSIKQKSLKVSLVEMPKIKNSITHKKIIKEKKEIKKKIGSKRAKIKEENENSIKNLFSMVKTPKKTKKIVTKKPKNLMPSRFKGESERKKESAKEILQKLNIKNVSKILAKTDIKAVKGENDPYWSKVQEILYKNWFPPQESAGNQAKVEIFIDRLGNFDYKVLLFSNNELFNKELLKYLEFLKTKKFPSPNEEKNIIVIFKAKE